MEVVQGGGGHGDDERCGAVRKGRPPCKNKAGFKTDHPGVGRCHLHGGSTPTHEKAGKLVLLKREAARFAPDMEVDEDPAQVLLSELRRARALAAYWEDQLASGQLWIVGDGVGGSKVLSVEGELWQRERDRAIAIATTCLRLGLEERRVRVAEGVGDAMYAAVEAGFAAAGIDMDSDQGRLAFERAAVAFEKRLGAGEAA
jgi:hypothetical protein